MTEKTNFRKKSVARLVACQTLCMYFDENNYDKNLSSILNTINENYIKVEIENCEDYNEVYEYDFAYNLVENTIENIKNYDLLINELLDKQNTTETLDEVLLNCFRLASFELENYCKNEKLNDNNKEINYVKTYKDLKNIIINDYTDIVAQFYDDLYINFANGIIENLAIKISGGEKKEKINKNVENKAKDKLDIDSNEKDDLQIEKNIENTDNIKNSNRKKREVIRLKTNQ